MALSKPFSQLTVHSLIVCAQSESNVVVVIVVAVMVVVVVVVVVAVVVVVVLQAYCIRLLLGNALHSK